jgi:hypothetical protein
MSTLLYSIASAAIQGPVVVVGTADCDVPLQQKARSHSHSHKTIHKQIVSQNRSCHNIDKPGMQVDIRGTM